MAGVGKNSEARDLPSAELGGRQATGGRGTMARGSAGVGPRDARKKRAEKP